MFNLCWQKPMNYSLIHLPSVSLHQLCSHQLSADWFSVAQTQTGGCKKTNKAKLQTFIDVIIHKKMPEIREAWATAGNFSVKSSHC